MPSAAFYLKRQKLHYQFCDFKVLLTLQIVILKILKQLFWTYLAKMTDFSTSFNYWIYGNSIYGNSIFPKCEGLIVM